ncbi:hypothetical protein HDE_01721 [Halotydeus destructor]|nr:hypothetical protein HDE_01721 [Halotydeus destructor]
MLQLASAKQLVKILTVEPFLFFIYLAITAKQDTYTQFYQDKVCLVNRQLSNEVCNFVSTSKDVQYLEDKTAIVNEANAIGAYQSLIQTVPAIIYAIMLAPWADKVKGARRSLMIATALGQILDSTIGIISVIYEDTLPPWTALAIGIPSSLVGGNLAVSVAVLGYASMTTPILQMPLRFIIMDVVQKAVNPMSTYSSGRLVSTPSWIPNKVRNFTAVYLLCFVSSLFALIWTLSVVDDSDWKDKADEQGVNKTYKFFNKENVFQLKNTLTRVRDNQGRIQFWVIIAINCFSYFAAIGPSSLRLPYAQVVYSWNITELQTNYSKFTALTLIIYSLGSPILTNRLNFSVPGLGIFGMSGLCLYLVSMATIMDPWGFYIANIIGSFRSVNAASVKAKMADTVDRTEKSSAFALLAISTNCTSTAAKWYYQQMFKHTLNTMPGLGFLTGNILLLLAISGWIWIDFHDIKTSKRIDSYRIDEIIAETNL